MYEAFGNGAPDVFSAFAAVVGDKEVLIGIGALLGGTMFVSTIVVGSICLLSDCQVSQTGFIRDLVFLIIAIIMISIVGYIGTVSIITAIVFFLLYVIYCILVLYSTYDSIGVSSSSIVADSTGVGDVCGSPTSTTGTEIGVEGGVVDSGAHSHISKSKRTAYWHRPDTNTHHHILPSVQANEGHNSDLPYEHEAKANSPSHTSHNTHTHTPIYSIISPLDLNLPSNLILATNHTTSNTPHDYTTLYSPLSPPHFNDSIGQINHDYFADLNLTLYTDLNTGRNPNIYPVSDSSYDIHDIGIHNTQQGLYHIPTLTLSTPHTYTHENIPINGYNTNNINNKYNNIESSERSSLLIDHQPICDREKNRDQNRGEGRNSRGGGESNSTVALLIRHSSSRRQHRDRSQDNSLLHRIQSTLKNLLYPYGQNYDPLIHTDSAEYNNNINSDNTISLTDALLPHDPEADTEGEVNERDANEGQNYDPNSLTLPYLTARIQKQLRHLTAPLRSRSELWPGYAYMMYNIVCIDM